MSTRHLVVFAAFLLIATGCEAGSFSVEFGSDEGFGLHGHETRLQELPSSEIVTGYRLPGKPGSSIYITQSPHAYKDNIWNAVDLGIGFNQEVRAMRGGVISALVDSNDDMPLGQDCVTKECNRTTNFLIIQHDDGNESAYFHLKKDSISGLGLEVGSTVCQGQIVARVGHNGFTTGPHVHASVQGGGSNGWNDIWSRKTKVIHFDEIGGPAEGAKTYVSQNEQNCTGDESTNVAVPPFCSGRLSGLWCDGDELVLCSSDTEADRQPCPHGCTKMAYGTPDECAPAPQTAEPEPEDDTSQPEPEPSPEPSPEPEPEPEPEPTPSNDPCLDKLNGYWCDGEDLIICQNDSEVSRSACESGCESMPLGTPDRCYPDFCDGRLNGYWCDGDDLVLCQADKVATREACTNGCNSQPLGYNDFCN